jgi:hypothetical protein
MQRPLDPRPTRAVHRLADRALDHGLGLNLGHYFYFTVRVRKPRISSLNRVGGIIFFLAVIVVSPMDFTVLARNARSSRTCGGDGRIGDLFERSANGIVQKFEAFRLRTHREHVGGLAGQAEQPIRAPR